MNAIDKTSQSREKLMADLRIVFRDTEELLANTGQTASEGFKVAKAKLEASLKTAKEELIRVEECVLEKTKEVVHATDVYVKDNPWKSVGIGAAVGVFVGLLVSRK